MISEVLDPKNSTFLIFVYESRISKQRITRLMLKITASALDEALD